MTDPLLVAALDHLLDAGVRIDPERVLSTLTSVVVSTGRENPKRYRWGLSWRAQPGSRLYESRHADRTHWRPAEREFLDEDPTAYGRRLIEPIALAAHYRYWGRVRSDPETDIPLARAAGALLDEATLVAEGDLSRWFGALDPWRDTLALWLLSREPEAVRRLRDLLFSLAVRYGAIAARTGLVRGLHYPFYGRPLVSASAHLASGLWAFGVYPSIIPPLVTFVGVSRDPDGGWADEGQPTDVLTTLAAADLMARLDPGFDPAPTISWFVDHQECDGWWRALNPEVPWLTGAVASWIRFAERPFAQRFSWPSAPIWSRDRLSGLTTMATLEELESVLGRLSPLADASIDVAFVDLAGFGEWNRAHGQTKGDEVIALLGGSLREIAEVLAVRIGGDEFELLGKPAERGELGRRLDAWRRAWPSRLVEIGAHGVAPRILMARGRVRDLRTLRHELGLGIAPLKRAVESPPPDGVIRPLTDFQAQPPG